MTKTLACIWLSPAERATLEGLVSGRNTPQKLVWRARIVLLSADGIGTMTIVRLVGKSKVTVWRWQERYLAKGIAGLRRDATRPGRKPPLSAEVIERVVHKTLHETPEAATHWSNLGNFMRTLALPDSVEQWSLTTLREKLIKIGAKIVRHGRYVIFQMAEGAIPRDLFADILRRIDRLRPTLTPA